jgi:glutathione S-transferase
MVTMSLWTPGGEVPVNRGGGDQGGAPSSSPTDEVPAGDAGASGMVGGPDLDSLSPEERAQAEAMVEQMAEVQRQILSAPASQFVTNHVVGFYELAAIHLGQTDPDLDAARLAIDAMAAVLDAVEDRLGDDGRALRDALSQLQVVFVQVRAAHSGEGDTPAT